MHSLFEASDSLNSPFECFIFDTRNEVFPVRPHWHYFMEMIYMLEGTAEMFDSGNRYIVRSGDCIIFHPKSIHSIFSSDGAPLRYAVLKFDLNQLNLKPAYAPKLKELFKNAEQKKMPIFFNSALASRMNSKTLFLSCVQEANEKSYGYDLMIQSHLYNLLMQIVRQWQNLDFSIGNEVFHASTSYDIDTITEYIEAHIRDSIQVSDIAQKCNMSYSCFAKKFHMIYGVSCKEYIVKIRIFKVEDYLLFTDFDLNYISQETGFSDCSHMIRNFKKYRGITPKQYRLKHSGKNHSRDALPEGHDADAFRY